jgi:mRNA interferase MazF
MTRSEVWWARLDTRRAVVILAHEADTIRAMLIVPPSPMAIDGVTLEVPVGAADGLPLEGVLRVALPRPGFIPCQWIVELTGNDLLERIGTLSGGARRRLDDALRQANLDRL